MAAAPTLAGCVPLDLFGITCVRCAPPDEVLSRLDVADLDSHPQFTEEEAIQHFGHGFETPAVRVYSSEGWTILLDVEAHGSLLQAPVLTGLSVGAEALSVWKLLDATTQISHARDGELLAHFNAWTFEPAEGIDPSRLNRALTDVGLFLDKNWESGEWSVPGMALLAVEQEFGLVLPAEIVRGPLPTVSLQHLADRRCVGS
ncbi:DUF6461 domain-containing protein [Streptomyces chartreusis]|uniref:DUF6461 domain-containing protein n=1 Tax=Streptomyces chartreusis TaxID=1969 RepID=UPI0036BF5EC8